MASYPVSWGVDTILAEICSIVENAVIFSFCLKISLSFTIDGEEKLRDESAAVLLLNHQVNTFVHLVHILGISQLLHISVFVRLDVPDGDLAHSEDGLSGGQTLPSLHGSMVDRTLLSVNICWCCIFDIYIFGACWSMHVVLICWEKVNSVIERSLYDIKILRFGLGAWLAGVTFIQRGSKEGRQSMDKLGEEAR